MNENLLGLTTKLEVPFGWFYQNIIIIIIIDKCTLVDCEAYSNNLSTTRYTGVKYLKRKLYN